MMTPVCSYLQFQTLGSFEHTIEICGKKCESYVWGNLKMGLACIYAAVYEGRPTVARVPRAMRGAGPRHPPRTLHFYVTI